MVGVNAGTCPPTGFFQPGNLMLWFSVILQRATIYTVTQTKHLRTEGVPSMVPGIQVQVGTVLDQPGHMATPVQTVTELTG